MIKLNDKTEARIDEIISKLTLKQKVGQMNQAVLWAGSEEYYIDRIRKGEIGTLICGLPNRSDDRSSEAERRRLLNSLQKAAIEESPCGIPLMFGADVVHSYDVCYPVPLASAASFDTELVEKCYRNIAEETSRDGLNWTFAPVLDLAHDPRWGRVVESGGEDPYLSGSMGAAIVRGFQGQLNSGRDLIACGKHFIGYGAMEGGRDYHNSDISDYFFNNWYTKPFKAAVDAGALTIMSSFNSVAGQPVTSSKKLLRDVLKNKMGFNGFVISDYDAVKQLKNQGVAEDDRDCARLAAIGGVDMEMVDNTYPKYLCELVKSGELDESVIDEAVRRVLRVKFASGLFDNPYRNDYDCDIEAHRADARQLASENVVLLKNNGILPLGENSKVFMTGPFLNERISHVGAWAGHYDLERIATYREAAAETVAKDKVSFSDSVFSETVMNEIPDDCDAVILFLGENMCCTGEAVSVADISVPKDQEELVRRARAKGIPVIGVFNFGRPRALGNVIDMLDAAVYGWHNGTMAAYGMLDVLYGRKNPCGKLPMTILRHIGQLPMYYNSLNTARSVNAYYGEGRSYYDMKTGPLYPFGYGLSYTRFEYSAPICSKTEISTDELECGKTVSVSVDVKNIGDISGKEVIQCYVRDHVGTMQRPVRQLCGFRKVEIAAGDTVSITFDIGMKELGYYGEDGVFAVEKGMFTVYTGENCLSENGIEIRVV